MWIIRVFFFFLILFWCFWADYKSLLVTALHVCCFFLLWCLRDNLGLPLDFLFLYKKNGSRHCFLLFYVVYYYCFCSEVISNRSLLLSSCSLWGSPLWQHHPFFSPFLLSCFLLYLSFLGFSQVGIGVLQVFLILLPFSTSKWFEKLRLITGKTVETEGIWTCKCSVLDFIDELQTQSLFSAIFKLETK